MENLKALVYDYKGDLTPYQKALAQREFKDLVERLEFLEKAVKNNAVLPHVSVSLPTEEQVLKTIFDCVFIRGIELEDYERNFTNEQSGLYDALVELFKGNDC